MKRPLLFVFALIVIGACDFENYNTDFEDGPEQSYVLSTLTENGEFENVQICSSKTLEGLDLAVNEMITSTNVNVVQFKKLIGRPPADGDLNEDDDDSIYNSICMVCSGFDVPGWVVYRYCNYDYYDMDYCTAYRVLDGAGGAMMCESAMNPGNCYDNYIGIIKKK